jgi:Glycosyl hydrolase catalytic core
MGRQELGGRTVSDAALRRLRAPALARSRFKLGRIAGALASLVVFLAATPTAGAAVRSEFFGIVQASTLDKQDVLGLKSAHVRTDRYLFPWYSVEKRKGSFAWAGQDKFIGRLAAQGIRAVPTIWGTPRWVSGDYIAHLPVDHPKDIQAWQTFLKAVVNRYGPNGFYWSHGYRQQYGARANPLPITSYQIWNEPNLKKYDTPYPSPARYGKLVVASHNAIKSVDPKAQVLLGGMPGTTPGSAGVTAWDFLGRLYQQVPGIKKDFDATALHPYASSTTGVQRAIVKFRTVMKNHGDAAKPLWISEIAWGSAPPDSRGINKGPSGQAQMLRSSYRLILNNRNAWNVQRLFWYHWRDPVDSQASCTFCGSAGLVRSNRTKKPAYTAFRSFTAETTPPKATITSGPSQGSVITDPTPTFGFKSSEGGSTFQCRFDSRSFGSCSSPFTPRTALADGPHTFSVKAIDAPGNVSAIASRSFTVNAH